MYRSNLYPTLMIPYYRPERGQYVTDFDIQIRTPTSEKNMCPFLIQRQLNIEEFHFIRTMSNQMMERVDLIFNAPRRDWRQ